LPSRFFIAFDTARAAAKVLAAIKLCPHPCPISGRASYSAIKAIVGNSALPSNSQL